MTHTNSQEKKNIPPKKIKLEKIIDLAKNGLAVLAIILGSSFNVTSINEASIHPNMKSIAVMDSREEFSGIKFKNSGLGDLLIKYVLIHDKNGKKIVNDSLYIQMAFNELMDFKVQPIQAKDALKEGEEHWFIASMENKNSPAHSQAIRNFLYNVNISICYCSIDNKCSLKSVGLKLKPSTNKQCTSEKNGWATHL